MRKPFKSALPRGAALNEQQVEPDPGSLPLRTVHVNAAFARLVGVLPQHLAQFPSMMSVDEKRLLFGAASKYFSGQGLIIDAGIFLGGSTLCFGEGLRVNSRFGSLRNKFAKPIISFDRAIVSARMPDFFKRNNVELDAAPGDSFADYLKNAIKPVEDLVDLRIGDIVETMKTLDEPIEILFLDVLKTPEVSKAVLSHFFPMLVPGRSIVVQQDYIYERLDYIKTDQEIFGDYFTYIGEVGSSAIFLCTRKIGSEAVAKLNGEISSSEQERFASIAMQRSIEPSRRFLMAVSKVCLLARLHGREVANEYYQMIRSEFPDECLSKSARLIEAKTLANRVTRPKR